MAKKAAAKPKLESVTKKGTVRARPSKGALVPVEKAPRVGNVNKASPPKVINQGHVPGSPSRAVVPYKAPASKLAGVGKALGKVAKFASGPVGFAIGMVADATPAGAGSDKPEGPLMKGNSVKVGPAKAPGLSRNAFDTGRATTPAPTPKKAAVAPPKAVARPSSSKDNSSPPKPTAKPSFPKGSSFPPKPTAKPTFSKGSSSPPAYAIPKAKPQVGGKVSSGFHGNWVGAAPSEMQKRGGARINRGGGLLGKLRSK